MRRITVRLPEDVETAIGAIKKTHPNLSNQDVIVSLIRKGVLHTESASLEEIKNSLDSLLGALSKEDSANNSLSFSDMCAIKTYAILRRFIHINDPESLKLCDQTAEELFKKVKE